MLQLGGVLIFFSPCPFAAARLEMWLMCLLNDILWAGRGFQWAVEISRPGTKTTPLLSFASLYWSRKHVWMIFSWKLTGTTVLFKIASGPPYQRPGARGGNPPKIMIWGNFRDFLYFVGLYFHSYWIDFGFQHRFSRVLRELCGLRVLLVDFYQ